MLSAFKESGPDLTTAFYIDLILGALASEAGDVCHPIHPPLQQLLLTCKQIDLAGYLEAKMTVDQK